MSTSDVLDRLNAVLDGGYCGDCGGPLGASAPSGDFCGETCQDRWKARQVDALPDDPAPPLGPMPQLSQEQVESLNRGLTDMTRVFQNVLVAASEAMREVGHAVRDTFPELQERHTPDGHSDVMQRALQARQRRNTGPRVPPPRPRTINGRGTR